MSLNINFIGAGSLGKTIGKLLVGSGNYKVNNILNTNITSSKAACEFIGHGTPIESINELTHADITFITTPDEKIAYILNELVKENKINKESLIIQCSGIISSEELKSSIKAPLKLASIHPIKSFADPKIAFDTFKGTHCAFEGDEEAFLLIKDMFESIGGIVFKIDSQKKALYHAGCAISSNFTVTITDIASKCFQDSGIEKKLALELANQLVLGAAKNIKKLKSTNKALTGPIKREETSTIAKHLKSINDDKLIKVYKALVENTLYLANSSPKFKKAVSDLIK